MTTFYYCKHMTSVYHRFLNSACIHDKVVLNFPLHNSGKAEVIILSTIKLQCLKSKLSNNQGAESPQSMCSNFGED